MTQDEAFTLLKLGENVFLTGAAGSGKTWLLNTWIRYLREHDVGVAVTASTGIAATHLYGRTIHSWSGIGVRETLTDGELDKLLRNKRLEGNYSRAKVLIIDEISMLHPQQLDMIERIARHMLDGSKAFGGLQVVLCGDFFQLPPVTRKGSEVAKQFACDAPAWERGKFRVCYLHEQHRHDNDPLLTILNEIRSGTAGEQTRIPLRTRYNREPEGGTKATRLYTHNVNVDAVNMQQLRQLPGKEQRFLMASRGFGALVEGLKKSCLAPEELILKTGAEVMFVKNATDGSYVNGTRGTVTGFERDTGWPVIRTFDRRTLTAAPDDWTLEEDGVIRATITQVPLRLAWAITVHKSQGMTLDAAEIDLGDAFEPGMGYVALSRIRRLSGLKLMNLNAVALQVHPDVLARDAAFRQQSKQSEQDLQEMSAETLQQRCEDILLHRFAGSAEKVPAGRKRTKSKVPTHAITLAMLKKGAGIRDIARERGLKTGTILSHVEKLKGLDDSINIDHLRKALPGKDFERILAAFQQSADGKLGPVLQKLKGKYSYEDLRLVRLFVEP